MDVFGYSGRRLHDDDSDDSLAFNAERVKDVSRPRPKQISTLSQNARRVVFVIDIDNLTTLFTVPCRALTPLNNRILQNCSVTSMNWKAKYRYWLHKQQIRRVPLRRRVTLAR